MTLLRLPAGISRSLCTSLPIAPLPLGISMRFLCKTLKQNPLAETERGQKQDADEGTQLNAKQLHVHLSPLFARFRLGR